MIIPVSFQKRETVMALLSVPTSLRVYPSVPRTFAEFPQLETTKQFNGAGEQHAWWSLIVANNNNNNNNNNIREINI